MSLQLVKDDPQDRPRGLHPVYKTWVGDLAVQWVRGRRRRGEIGGRSPKVYMSRLASFLDSYGDRPVGEMDRHDIEAWQEALEGLAPASRRAAQTTVSMFCKWLVLEGHLDQDPTLTMGKVRERRRVPRALTWAEVQAVLGACRTKKRRAMVWLMAGCGLRCVEVANLDVSDYDPVGRTLFVRGKFDNERVLPVPDEVAEALDAYRRSVGSEPGPFFRPAPSTRYRTNPERMEAHSVSTIVSQIMQRAGVHHPGDGRSAHALRHSCASDVLDRCHDVRIVQAILGHASLATTQVYLRRANLDQMRDAMAGRDYLASAPPEPSISFS